jgi:hypothetical protein
MAAFLDIQFGIDGTIVEILNKSSLRLNDNAGVCSHYRFAMFVSCPEENTRQFERIEAKLDELRSYLYANLTSVIGQVTPQPSRLICYR